MSVEGKVYRYNELIAGSMEAYCLTEPDAADWVLFVTR